MDLEDIPYVEGMSISVMPPASEYYDDPFWYDSGGRNPLVQREIFKLEAGEERTRRLKGILQEFRLYGPLLYEVAAEAGRADIIRLLFELGANPKVDPAYAGSDSESETGSIASNKAKHENGAQQDDSATVAGGSVETTSSDVTIEPTSMELDSQGNADKQDEQSGTHDRTEHEGESLQDQHQDQSDDVEQSASASDTEESENTPMIAIHPPLTGAAFAGQLECVQVLLDEVEVDIDECDKNGSALAYAVSGGHTEVVNLLLSRGASICTKPGRPDIMSLALKGGNAEVMTLVLESNQWKTSAMKITIEHLPFASFGGSTEALNLVLSYSDLPSPTGDVKDLTSGQSEAIFDAIVPAIGKSVLASLHLLLPYVVRQESDGSYFYFEGPEHWEIKVFNATEDAMDIADDPDLFRLAWDSIIHRPGTGPDDTMARTPHDADGKPNITLKESLHRRLISAAGRGRVETTKLIVDHYGADVNHVSHKYSTTCLGRAAAEGRHDLQGRLKVVRYLLEHTNVDPSIAQGEFANGPTPLAYSVIEGQKEMVKLLLELGGPVDSIEDDVRSLAEQKERGERVEICVVYFPKHERYEVRIMAKEAYEKVSWEERTRCVTLEWEEKELLSVLGRLQLRGSDEDLRKADPKGRPLSPMA